jgi:tetratricopeptide (TPR) repeat protein
MAKGDYTEAEIYLKQALDFALRNKAALGEAQSSLNLGSLYIQRLRTDQGLPLVERALALYQQGAYRRSIANCLKFIGRARRRMGDYDKALAAYDQYKQIAEQVGDQSQLGSVYGETAAVFAEQENYPKALELYEQSFAIFKAIGDQMDLAYNLLNRAELLWRLGRYDESRALLAQSSEMAEKPGGGYKPLLAAIELDKAESELSQRRFTNAIAQSKKAIDDAGDQYTDVVIIAKYTMGQAKAFSGKKLEGKQLCEDAVTRAGQTGDQALLSRAMLALAVSQYESGEYGTSFANANAAAERFSRGAQFQSQWRAWSLAAKAAQQNVDSGATQLSERATETLNKLQQSWGAASFESYLTRPDVRFFQQKFGGSSPSDH